MKELIEIIQSQNDRITKLEKRVSELMAFVISDGDAKERNIRNLSRNA